MTSAAADPGNTVTVRANSGPRRGFLSEQPSRSERVQLECRSRRRGSDFAYADSAWDSDELPESAAAQVAWRLTISTKSVRRSRKDSTCLGPSLARQVNEIMPLDGSSR